MRWQPDTDVCDECGFAWTVAVAEAIEVVRRGPAAVTAALPPAPAARRSPGPGMWSAAEYVWHLVDVLRIGRERLWTLRWDPGAGIPCWDENALAVARRYPALSTAVGLRALEDAAAGWVSAALETDPAARTTHPMFGVLTRDDVIRRNAHEMHHHLLDVRRLAQSFSDGDSAPPGST